MGASAGRTGWLRGRPDKTRRLRRLIGGLVIALIVVAIAWADRSGKFVAERSPAAQAGVYEGAETTVVRIVDGDTLIVAIADSDQRERTTRVRLWGVDAPELGKDGKPNEPFARDARAFAERMTEGRRVRLRVEQEKLRDHYGRVLAHVLVETAEGERSLGEALVEAGLAEHVPKWSNSRTRELGAAQRRARDAGRGIWSAPRGRPGASRGAYTPPEAMRFNLFRSGLDLLSAGERVRREHERWLTLALSRRGPAPPRIPVRKVDEGGFAAMLAAPGGRERAEQWWMDAFAALEGGG